MKIFTTQEIRNWQPCFDLSKYLTEDWEGTILDILDRDYIPFQDRLWVVCRPEFLSDKLMRLFAVWCARQVKHLMKDKRSIEALDVAERYALGTATKKELRTARDAAWDAACVAAWVAAEDAAWYAARETAWYAARETAWNVARAAQKTKLKKNDPKWHKNWGRILMNYGCKKRSIVIPAVELSGFLSDGRQFEAVSMCPSSRYERSIVSVLIVKDDGEFEELRGAEFERAKDEIQEQSEMGF